LNRDNGRLAQIILASAESGSIALMADVTATVSCETLLAASLNWADKLSSRKHDPIDGVTLAAQRTKADELRRLCALLKAGNRERLRIVKLPAVESDDAAKVLRHFTPSELWKAKPRKITLPEGQE